MLSTYIDVSTGVDVRNNNARLSSFNAILKWALSGFVRVHAAIDKMLNVISVSLEVDEHKDMS